MDTLDFARDLYDPTMPFDVWQDRMLHESNELNSLPVAVWIPRDEVLNHALLKRVEHTLQSFAFSQGFSTEELAAISFVQNKTVNTKLLRIARSELDFALLVAVTTATNGAEISETDNYFTRELSFCRQIMPLFATSHRIMGLLGVQLETIRDEFDSVHHLLELVAEGVDPSVAIDIAEVETTALDAPLAHALQKLAAASGASALLTAN